MLLKGKRKLDKNMFKLIMVVAMIISMAAFAEDCEEQELVCVGGPETREFEGTDVYKDCWQYKYKLNCDKKSKNDCAKISADDCLFVKEECIEKKDEVCLNHRQDFVCEKEEEHEEEREELINTNGPNAKGLLCKTMCLDGDCDAIKKAATEENQELSEAAATLNALSEAKKGIEGNTVNVFKGGAATCKKDLVNFLNCCSLKGWGESFGAKCGENAKNLVKKRLHNKCVEVGKFCSKKIKPFGCTSRKTTFCCYDSILAKIINQEAKKQLGISNGTPKVPNCDGVALEDFDKVDLSKADFSEFYREIVVSNINIPDVQIDVKTNTKTAEEIANIASNDASNIASNDAADSAPEIQKGFKPGYRE